MSMSGFRLISANDAGAANEIVGRTYELLRGMELQELDTPEVKTPEVIGISGVCVEVSDAVTRAALDLGILASREYHGGHYFTSFGSLDRLPAEDDPILCLTWGQFNPAGFESQPFNEFFGRRRDLIRYLGDHIHTYGDHYSAASTVLRQVTHTPTPGLPSAEHMWLETTPEDLITDVYPVGEVRPEDFPEMWEVDLRLAA